MARSCPKNTNNNRTKARETTTEKPTSATPASNLIKAQQICTLEEAMAEEERAKYLDAQDMGQDFWSARA